MFSLKLKPVARFALLNVLQLSVEQQKLKFAFDVTQALEQANVNVAAFGAKPLPNNAVTF